MTEFDKFWTAWPNKKSKGYARTAFERALKKTDAATIMAAIPVYIKNKPDWKAFMHPATWLNGECWDDEPEDAPQRDANWRSYDTWSDDDKEECRQVLLKYGIENGARMFRYRRDHIKGLRADGYFLPTEARTEDAGHG